MFRRNSGFIILIFIITAFTIVTAGKWGLLESVDARETSHYKMIKTFTESLSLVKKNYVEKVDEKELVYGAVRGMLNSLDPHSSFMPPEAFTEMKIDTKGEFGGLGIQIGIKDKILTIIAPIEDTPADKAGVKAGDKIIKIEGESTKDISLHDAVSKLRGKKGTPVTITIARKSLDKPLDITIVRDIIKIKSVKSRIIDETIGYVKLTQFQEKSSKDLKKAIGGIKGVGKETIHKLAKLLELNGAAISHAELKNNDWINIGGVEFQFTDDGVNEIKETTKTAAASLRSVKPAMVKQLVQPLETVKEKPVVQSNNDKTMTTKEYVAKSRYSRRRLAF